MINKLALSLLLTFLILPQAHTQVPTAADKIQNVGVFTELGSKVDLDTQFTDSEGVLKSIKDFYLPEKPLIIMPVYYECPSLCGITIQSAIALINDLEAKLGEDFSILTVSFSPRETPKLAKRKSETVFKELKDPEAAKKGWHFTVGTEENIDKLLNQLAYKLQADGDDYSHASAIFVLSPDGKISQFFTGVNFPVWDVKLSLVDASKGKVGTLLHQAALFCFQFDPIRGKYTMTAMTAMRVVGVLTLIAMFVGWLVLMVKRRRR